MNRENFYRLIIVLLLLVNFGILAYLLIGNNDRRGPGRPEFGPPRPDRMIIERLKLDEEQQEQFHDLKHEHHTQMLDAQETSADLHRKLFVALKDTTVSTATTDSLYAQLAQNQLRKERATFDHLKKLRSILKPEQEPYFDELVEDLSERIMGPHRPHR
jgi:Spy/CpxP family protein refolding chaperone